MTNRYMANNIMLAYLLLRRRDAIYNFPLLVSVNENIN